MPIQPEIETERLVLRPFILADAPAVQRMASSVEIARTTRLIPHPYEDGMAEDWISSHSSDFASRKAVHYAIVVKEGDVLCGAISVTLHLEHKRGDLGYWIGEEHWNRGYATEATESIINFCFAHLNLNKVFAHYMKHNLASERVLEKCGMKYEGMLRQHYVKWGQYVDIGVFGLLAEGWRQSKARCEQP